MKDQRATVLRQLRLRAGLTQEELAERAGLSVRTIRGLETGTRRNPQLTSLRRLADAMDLARDERDQLVTLGSATPAASVSPVPRQLPAPPRGFTGRDNELTALTHARDAAAGQAPTVVITAVAGAGGIGKTSLAVHWAHHQIDRFPDGQLFVDLRGFSPDTDPLDPLIAVRGFLDALGVASDRIPVDLDGQVALYRSLVAGKRMLVVLDNAAGDEQVEPLLPGTPTCTVLVTSRRTLTALITRYGARHLPLGIFTEREAHALVAQHLGDARVAAEPDVAAALIRLCGRYPLALTLMASRAQARPRIPLAEFAAELAESGLDTLDDVVPAASLPAVLSWSLRNLGAEQRTMFALLGTAPGDDISLPAAASLTGLPLPRARTVLRELEEASLLDRRPGDRYAMHDLIRAYAATIAYHSLADEEREGSLRRILDFYLHTGHTAARLLDPHRRPLRLDPSAPGTHPRLLPDVPAALVWFDTEHPCLLAAQHTAAIRGWHHIVWQLAWTLTAFYYRRGHRRERLAIWRAAVDAAEHLPDPTAGTYAHRNLGSAYAALERHEEAIGHLHQALALAGQHRNHPDQAHAHRALASVWGLTGDDQRALHHATHALELFRVTAQPMAEARALNLVGWFAARLGDYDTARARCQAALPLHRKHNNRDGEAESLDILGYVAQHTGHHQEAIDRYQQALSVYRGLGDTYLSAGILDRLGYPYVALGEHDRARTVWREALKLYRQQGRDEGRDHVQRQLDDLG